MYGSSKKKKKPATKMKGKECSACGETQHNVPKRVKDSKKVKPKEVFGEGYKKAGGSKSKKK